MRRQLFNMIIACLFVCLFVCLRLVTPIFNAMKKAKSVPMAVGAAIEVLLNLFKRN